MPLTIRRLIVITPLPTKVVEFEWPTVESVKTSQRLHLDSCHDGLSLTDGLFRGPGGAVGIPDPNVGLQLRLASIAHNGFAGYRARQATELALRKEYFWTTLQEVFRHFVQSCIHCLFTTWGGEGSPSVWSSSPWVSAE